MQPSPEANFLYCSQCGQPKGTDELARFGDALICGACKAVYAQRLREGVRDDTLPYAGFFPRLAAALIDGILVMIPTTVIQLLIGRDAWDFASPNFSGLAFAVMYIVSLALGSSYEAWFVNKAWATPGKMALGLRVVRPDRSRVGLARGYGRYFAKILSGMILGIGYLMVFFDKERRALHDMICDTRVVRSRG